MIGSARAWARTPFASTPEPPSRRCCARSFGYTPERIYEQIALAATKFSTVAEVATRWRCRKDER